MNHGGKWNCPRCGESLSEPDALHECGVYNVTTLFSGVEPQIYEVFLRLENLVHKDEVEITARRTGVEFIAGDVFAFIEPRFDHLLITLRLDAVDRSPRFTAIEQVGPRVWLHTLRLERDGDLDDALAGWLERARG